MATNTAEAAASDFIIPGSISQAAIDRYVEAALEADPVRVDWRRLHEWSELDAASVTVPTLLIQGEQDPIASTEAHASFFSEVDAADREWVVVPGGDHAAFLETPRPYFLQALVSFMERPR
jgi:pimeloyl-ACP methyl ester carboxylesterase